jgi:threonine dehydratase
MFATVSSGNHGQGFAQACRLQGVTVHVAMPKPFPALKHRAVLGYGAQVDVFQNRNCTDERVRELVDSYQPVVVQPYTICS